MAQVVIVRRRKGYGWGTSPPVPARVPPTSDVYRAARRRGWRPSLGDLQFRPAQVNGGGSIWPPDAPPKIYDWNGVGTPPYISAPTAGPGAIQIQFPLPDGGLVSATVTPPGTQPAGTQPIISQDTTEKVKQWLNAQTIVAGYENYKVLAAGAAVLFLLRRKAA